MELKENYEQTEIGLIPENWKVENFGEKFTIKNGLNKAKEFFGYGTPIVNYMDVFGNSGIQKKDVKGKVCLTYREKENYRVNVGDILFTRTSETPNEIGMSSVLLEKIKDAVFSGFVLRARPKDKTYNNEFKKYCFRSSQIRKQIISTCSYTTRALTNGNSLSAVLILTPPLPEQKAIAQVLSDTDSLIQTLEQKIAKKRAVKQGAMQRLLTPKEDWEVRKLGEIGEIITGSTPPTKVQEYWNGNIPWITPTDISNKSRDIISSERKITPSGLKAIRKLPANTLLVTCIASIGKNSILRKAGACNQQINAVIPFADYNVEYLYYLIENNKKLILSKAGITATLMVSKKVFSVIEFQIPTLKVQKQISSILYDMDGEIQGLDDKLEKYRVLKQGLMQELLTGRIRLV